MSKDPVAVFEDLLTRPPGFRNSHYWKASRDFYGCDQTYEAVRVVLETEQGMFFVSGSASPTGAAENLLSVLAREIGSMPNTLVIEGHTDAKPFRAAGPTSGYSNWELAVDRANAARRLLNASGLRS